MVVGIIGTCSACSSQLVSLVHARDGGVHAVARTHGLAEVSEETQSTGPSAWCQLCAYAEDTDIARHGARASGAASVSQSTAPPVATATQDRTESGTGTALADIGAELPPAPGKVLHQRPLFIEPGAEPSAGSGSHHGHEFGPTSHSPWSSGLPTTVCVR